ncbi:SDR family oxidoreductase [Pedobacter duraquae]|uniref:Nucleoside-diphosphate-sugar epimerase n=1 Tax=Pedobacter duraquae TaxID=425511 RepID=A0A4R6IP87_9SPHI|nr:SDR family oxidoreductase [Pedobacter duraquae]TDO24080.1 nucleoside-diphosphate-sugar epimerase [Pedobacter duraquae]
MPDKKNISILGCGWYGLALAEQLISLNYGIKGSTTSAQKAEMLNSKGIHGSTINLESPTSIENTSFFTTDLLIITIPARDSTSGITYLDQIDILIKTIIKNEVKLVILISSTSVYGEPNKEVTENDPPNPNTSGGKLLATAEQKFMDCPAFRTTILRFGGLYGPGRDPGRFLAGKKMIPNGLAPVNLIHLQDCIGITISIIEKEAFGHVINACSPVHPSRKDFYTAAALRSRLESPIFIEECKNWKIVSSVKITELLDYQFNFYCGDKF